MDDAVCVDVEGDLNLGHAAGCGGDAGQLEGTQVLVVASELTLTLEDLNGHGGLVVLCGGEGLGTLGRDCGVAFDQLGHHAALGLDTEGEGGDVDQQNVLTVALQNACLQSCTHCHDLVGVHALVGLAAGELLDELSNSGHTGGATDQDDLGNLGDGHASFLDYVEHGLLGALEQVAGQFLELCAGQLLIQVDGALGGHGQVLQGDVGARSAGQLLLSLLSCLLQTLQSDLVLGQVCAGVCLHLCEQPLDDAVVPVVTTEAVVTAGCANLNGGEAVVVLANFQQGDVEGTATEVEDQDELVFLTLVQTVCQCCGGGLVDDTQDVQACDLAGFLGCLTLSVVEVCRDGDDGVGDGVVQECLCVALQLHEDTSGDFLRGVLLAVNLGGPVGAHVALDGGDGAVDVGHCLTLCDATDQNLAILGECDDGGGGASALCVSDDDRVATFQCCYDRVGGTEVNTYCTCHMFIHSLGVSAPLLLMRGGLV